MTRAVQVIVLACATALLLRLVVTDEYLYYVKPSMRIPIILAAIVLAALALFAAWDAWRATGEDAIDDGCAHDHGGDGHAHGEPRAALLLALPLMAVLLIAPAPLGAFSAARSTAPPPPSLLLGSLDALPKTDPVDLPVSDFIRRTTEGDGASVKGRSVRLEGFVTPNPKGGWWLTRMIISCCAADAYPARVAIASTTAPSANAWVRVTGTWVPGSGERGALMIPTLAATGVTPIPAPSNPYQR